ncbi:MAG: hypothetical protein U1F09_10140 [Steroidobacteraceae bacterium]
MRPAAGRRRRLVGALGCALFATVAIAGPPFVTDDPVPTDHGHWEIYAYGAGSRADDATSGEAGFDINYGAGEQLQLTLVLPAAWEGSLGGNLDTGTVQMAAKYRLTDPDGSFPVEVAVFPRVFLPTVRDGAGAPGVSVLLPVWLGRTAGPWYLFGGGGYQLNPGRGNRNFWTGGIAASRSVLRGLDLGAEIYGQTPDADGAQSFLGFNIGVVWSMSPRWSLLASGGAGLVHAHLQGQNDFYVGLRADY